MQQSESLVNALGHGMVDKRIDILRQIGQGGFHLAGRARCGRQPQGRLAGAGHADQPGRRDLVERVVGGAGGGGAAHARGRAVVAAADAVCARRAMSALAQLEGGGADPTVARLSLRTSMRNQWPCIVQDMRSCGQIVRVHLCGVGLRPPAWPVTARITLESAGTAGPARGCAGAGAVQDHGGTLCWQPPRRQCRQAATNGQADSRVSRGELGDEVAAAGCRRADGGLCRAGLGSAGHAHAWCWSSMSRPLFWRFELSRKGRACNEFASVWRLYVAFLPFKFRACAPYDAPATYMPGKPSRHRRCGVLAAMSDDVILKTSHLDQRIQGLHGRGDVNLSARRGSIHALIGLTARARLPASTC